MSRKGLIHKTKQKALIHKTKQPTNLPANKKNSYNTNISIFRIFWNIIQSKQNTVGITNPSIQRTNIYPNPNPPTTGLIVDTSITLPRKYTDS